MDVQISFLNLLRLKENVRLLKAKVTMFVETVININSGCPNSKLVNGLYTHCMCEHRKEENAPKVFLIACYMNSSIWW